MNVLIFNGSIDNRPYATSNRLATYLEEQFKKEGFTPEIFSLGDHQVPFFEQHDPANQPPAVKAMCEAFCKAELHIWMTPLYHGSMTGAMKNCLDWLELTSKYKRPYLSGKVVALLSWADGTQAMQGINAMDAVAKALRAWVLPYSLPILKDNLYDPQTSGFTAFYQNKLDTMVQLLCAAKSHVAAGMEERS
ncbi:NADPH-dependent FMN reductase [Chitinophaga nivalis]|uniref:NAD(P)H-dependent oxidoreductase n=1 Tax=Chitinophaga nivalis TaxID=2991709 RepID=A0ABT3IIG8_9BACT|nr:NAD(P)H-dependent oxidoreductase [Chitinophaga nivalis]MCW3466552.1 NAD(P)H-dependent oxidoreductase [Chitinophaga nivalis]MCW3483757.1 NAD(P)H-dependent oxidoreductase [Chitinophaga nivalis]